MEYRSIIHSSFYTYICVWEKFMVYPEIRISIRKRLLYNLYWNFARYF
jgi:hypothetical protein